VRAISCTDVEFETWQLINILFTLRIRRGQRGKMSALFPTLLRRDNLRQNLYKLDLFVIMAVDLFTQIRRLN
jgi:hypothetical protein